MAKVCPPTPFFRQWYGVPLKLDSYRHFQPPFDETSDKHLIELVRWCTKAKGRPTSEKLSAWLKPAQASGGPAVGKGAGKRKDTASTQGAKKHKGG